MILYEKENTFDWKMETKASEMIKNILINLCSIYFFISIEKNSARELMHHHKKKEKNTRIDEFYVQNGPTKSASATRGRARGNPTAWRDLRYDVGRRGRARDTQNPYIRYTCILRIGDTYPRGRVVSERERGVRDRETNVLRTRVASGDRALSASFGGASSPHFASFRVWLPSRTDGRTSRRSRQRVCAQRRWTVARRGAEGWYALPQCTTWRSGGRHGGTTNSGRVERKDN